MKAKETQTERQVETADLTLLSDSDSDEHRRDLRTRTLAHSNTLHFTGRADQREVPTFATAGGVEETEFISECSVSATANTGETSSTTSFVRDEVTR